MEWLAVDRTDPIGDERGDLQAAVIAQVVFNMMRGPRSKAASLQDFLLKFGGPTKKTPEEMLQVFQLADAFSKQMKSKRQGN